MDTVFLPMRKKISLSDTVFLPIICIKYDSISTQQTFPQPSDEKSINSLYHIHQIQLTPPTYEVDKRALIERGPQTAFSDVGAITRFVANRRIYKKHTHNTLEGPRTHRQS